MTQLTINTTQNVEINFVAASVGERIVAQLIDLLVIIAYILVMSWLQGELRVFDFFDDLDGWSQMAVGIVLGAPAIFYTLTQEVFFQGQTLGKRVMQLRVIKIDGYQAGFGDYLTRWLFRIIEVFIGSGVFGLIAIVTSKRNQRMGDMAAGTAVITLKNKVNINHTILQEVEEAYQPKYPAVIQLTDNDVRIIKETFEMAIKAKDFSTITKLCEKVQSVTNITNTSKNDQDFIRTILKDYNFYTQNM